MKRFLNFIKNHNIRRKAIYALCLCALLTAATIFGAATYARFYSSYKEAAQAQVAKYAFAFQNVSLKRGNEVVAIDKDANTCEISDIKPNDVINYTFTFADVDETKINEVRLRVTLNITVRIDTMKLEGSVPEISSTYFAAGSQYPDVANDLRSGAELQLYKDAGGYTLIPYAQTRHDVDYTCSELYVHEESGADGKINNIDNKVGFYMEPYSGNVTVHKFRLQFNLPNQVDLADAYAGARLIISVHADVEQAQATEEAA